MSKKSKKSKKEQHSDGPCEQCKKLIDICNQLYERLSALVELPKPLTPKYILKTNDVLEHIPLTRKGFTKTSLINWATFQGLKRDEYTISVIKGVDNSVEARHAGKQKAYQDGNLQAAEL